MMRKEIDSILRRSMTLIADRFERHGGRYPWIDTKFDIVTGRDYDENDEPFRRRECIYSWIQGRGLESLAGHIGFFRAVGETVLAERLTVMLRTVTGAMEELRRRNSGRLPFAMRPDGTPFFPGESSCANYSDLFYGKGLAAAGEILSLPDLTAAGEELFRFVLADIEAGKFHTDQQSFDPKNPVAFVPGKFPQGPRMIALGGLADQIRRQPEEPFWAETAERFINFILAHHVNRGRYPQLQEWDFIESVDARGEALAEAGVIFSDPGHALEFVGLTGKVLLALRRQGRCAALVRAAGEMLVPLFLHVLEYGFNTASGGICKGFDLISRRVLNSDMPWWNLPESLRAAVELAALCPGSRTAELQFSAGRIWQAFTQGFLQPNGFACQTRDAAGRIIRVIPAVSDADPGYHTNLSLLDVRQFLP